MAASASRLRPPGASPSPAAGDEADGAAFLLGLADALLAAPDPLDARRTASRMLRDRLGADRVAWWDAAADGEGVVATAEDAAPGLPSLAGWRLDPTTLDAHAFARLARGQPVGRRGVHAYLHVPFVRDGRLAACVTVYFAGPHRWTEAELALLREAARRTREAADRIAAEAALRDGDARLRALVSASSYGVFRISADWRRLRQLDASLAQVGPVVEDWAERFLLPEDRPRIHAAIERATRDCSNLELEHRVRLGAGGVGWMLTRAVPLLDADGRIVEWFGACSEVTGRKQTEIALSRSEERLRQFGEASRDVLWIRDSATLQWQYLTPAFEAIFGVGREDALGGDDYRNWLDLMVAEDRGVADAAIRRVVGGEYVTYEYRIRRPADGEIRWLRNTAFPIANEVGEITLIGGICEDVTAAKLAQEALERSEERLQSAVEVGRVALWDWNMRTDETYWSAEHFRMEGYPVDGVQPGYEAWASRVHPDDRPNAEAALAHARDARTEYVCEFRVMHPDGSVHWLDARGRFFYEGDQPVRMVGAMVETTSRREWEERQKVLVAELQHRTRNLIGVVRSMADKTARRSGDMPDFRQRFRNRLDALARVQGLLSRLHEHDRVTFDELVHTELSAMEGSSDRVTLEGPPDVRLRSSTVQTLALALHELATNATKYGALSQPDARLAVSWRLESVGAEGRPWLHIDWRESGVEMPPPRHASERGQGRELIEQALPYQLHAQTRYELGSDGVHCTISLPVSQSTVEPRSHV